MNMKLVVEPGYEPGHVSMYYGDGLVTLAELIPEGLPKEGDYRIEFTVNGDWRFTFSNSEHTIDFWRPDQITPKVESLIYHSFDADKVEYNGDFYEIQWINNNWFEAFVYKRVGDNWEEVNEGDIIDCDLGPTEEEFQIMLQSILESYK